MGEGMGKRVEEGHVSGVPTRADKNTKYSRYTPRTNTHQPRLDPRLRCREHLVDIAGAVAVPAEVRLSVDASDLPRRIHRLEDRLGQRTAEDTSNLSETPLVLDTKFWWRDCGY